MMLHTYTPYPISLPSINFLHPTVSELQPRQIFPPDRRPTHPAAMGENNIINEPEGFYSNKAKAPLIFTV